jgi:ankyrin repeat protein
LNANTQKDGSTPLHLACRDGHEKICLILIQNGWSCWIEKQVWKDCATLFGKLERTRKYLSFHYSREMRAPRRMCWRRGCFDATSRG